MNFTIKQVSSLEKILPGGFSEVLTVNRQTLMRGETFSYQIAIESSDNMEWKPEIDSPLKESIKLYAVKNITCDHPAYPDADDDYITKSPSLIPDLLMPIELEKNFIRIANGAASFWITVKIPEDTVPGEYPITTLLSATDWDTTISATQKMTIEVIDATLPVQQTKFTQWFHVDCIATAHNVEIYSEEHWNLIEKYIALASELGINMLLTPVITPPLDTNIGLTRPCTQLVKIEKTGEKYNFDFSLLKRWISLCHKNGIKYFEISHLFSQWGLKYAPNIKVTENGVEDYMFGWHTDAQSDEYRDFLTQFLPQLIAFLDEEGIKDNCWFHVSDEPSLEHLPAYKYAKELITPLIKDAPTFDAISNYEFFETGLIANPVVSTNHIEPFLENNVENFWAYYCCVQGKDVGNRFLAMPSYRNRILGLQLYKSGAKGFLQWGYNFYFSQRSVKKINPYVTTSGDMAFPSGDSFSVYPIENGVAPSLRAVIFKEALNDVEICRMLEKYIGRDKVIEMIDHEADMNLTYSVYPRNPEFVPKLIEKMKQMIKKYACQ